jgi:hypothetical protein
MRLVAINLYLMRRNMLGPFRKPQYSRMETDGRSIFQNATKANNELRGLGVKYSPPPFPTPLAYHYQLLDIAIPS